MGGRCMCNGHAFVCPPSEADPDVLQCHCQHGTDGINCNRCSDDFPQKRWRQYTSSDPFECEPCQCHGHSDKCYFDEDVERQVHGRGGGYLVT